MFTPKFANRKEVNMFYGNVDQKEWGHIGRSFSTMRAKGTVARGQVETSPYRSPHFS